MFVITAEKIIRLENVRNTVLTAARITQAPICYSDLAEALDLPTRGHHMANTLGALLGDLIDLDCNNNLPLTSALVVNKTTGIPGPGFFKRLPDSVLDSVDVKEIRLWRALAATVSSPAPELTAGDKQKLWRALVSEFPFIYPRYTAQGAKVVGWKLPVKRSQEEDATE